MAHIHTMKNAMC